MRHHSRIIGVWCAASFGKFIYATGLLAIVWLKTLTCTCIGNSRVKKGDRIFIPILALSVYKEIWGEDASEFK